MLCVISILLVSCGNNNNTILPSPSIEANDSINKTKEFRGSDGSRMGLKGKVISCKQEEYLANPANGEIGEKTGANSFIYKFNDNGNKISETYLDNEGLISQEGIYEFDSQNRKSKKQYRKK